MKRSSVAFLFVMIFFLALIGGCFFWWKSNSSPVAKKSSEEVSFLIPRGRGASEVGLMLEKEGLIKSALAFKIYVQLSDKTKNINAGEFSLSPGMSIVEIVDVLGKGPKEVWITIPEGLRREEIVELFITGLGKDDSRGVFRSEFLELTSGREGYIYPDTYLLPKDATAQQVVKLIDSTFDKRVDNVMLDAISKSGRSIHQIITLASLIEKETKNDPERPIVAGIILKRIDNDWTPDIDASVQYATANRICGIDSECDDWWPIITLADIEAESQYNTYKNLGLPPGPIANPGISSIRAAIYPEDSPYWFYIHDSSGMIHYGKTLEEHNLNVSKYLR